MSKAHIVVSILNYIYFLMGSLICFTLQKSLGLSSVLSAAITGLLASFLHPIIHHHNKGHKADFWDKRSFAYFESLVFIGAFVAMDARSLSYANHYIVWPFLVQSLLGFTLFLILKKYFSGIGGRLGLMAFIICLISLLTRLLLTEIFT